MDIMALKKLGRQSIIYSMMTEEEKQTALAAFDSAFERFLSDALAI